jgi:hypothetical protein
MRRLTSTGCSRTSKPATHAFPCVGGSTPMSMLIVVDLPRHSAQEAEDNAARYGEVQLIDGHHFVEAAGEGLGLDGMGGFVSYVPFRIKHRFDIWAEEQHQRQNAQYRPKGIKRHAIPPITRQKR